MITGKADKELFMCAYPEWQQKRESTTFWDDFTIADAAGDSAIQDTYNRAFNAWKTNCKYFTELVAVLNHKLWFWYRAGDEKRSKLYDELWKKADAYGCKHFTKEEEAEFFFMVLD